MNESRTFPPLLLILACVVTYANGLQGEFVYDDVAVTVVDNPFLAGLVGWREVLHWDRPVREFTYLLDHALWGERPYGYHLQNLLWHVLNVLLLWRIQQNIGMDRWRACLAALLFAIHPINTEAVTWISGRKELLCLFFELSTVWLFLRFLRPNTWPHGYGLAALLSLCLALYSKQVAVMLPFLLVVVAWSQGGGFTLRRRRVLVLLSLLIVVTVLVALVSLRAPEVARETMARGTYYDPSARHLKLEHPILTGLAVWWRATALLIVPYPLVIERMVVPVTSWTDPRWILGALIAAILLGILWRYRGRMSQSLGIAWILITWLPTSGILPATYLLADRYLYIPCVGLCLCAGSWFNALFDHRAVLMRRLGVGLVTTLVISYTFLSVSRNQDWANEVSLWKSAAKYEPSNPKVHFNLGNAYDSEEFTDLAEQEWKRALSLRPDYPAVHINLGRLYQRQEMFDPAESHYRAALDIVPGYGVAMFNLALLHRERGNLEEAIRLMRLAAANIAGKRDTPQKKALAYRELGRLLLESGQPREALAAAEESLRYHPRDQKTRMLLSQIKSALTATP